MATAVITPNFTILSTCDSTTGWTGLATLDTEFFLQGTGSVSGTTRTTGDRYFTPATAVNLTNTHIRMWFNFAAPSFLDLTANGGVSIYLFDGTNTARYYLKGSDNYNGGWVLLTVYTGNTPSSGTVNFSNITRVGVTVTLTSSPRNVVNTWVDYLVYGNSVEITGGLSNDPITWSNIASADLAGGYGAIQLLNGVYFVNTKLFFGDGTNSLDTYFEDSNQLIVFENQPVNSTLYAIEPVGSATNTTSFKLNSSVIKAASQSYRFDLIFNNANLDTLEFNANTIINADNTTFKSGQTSFGNTWTNSNQIITNSASFYNNTITGSTDTGGAVLFPNDNSIYDCVFNSNTYAIEMDTTGTYTYNNLTFNSNTTDINNTSGGSITINATNGADPSTFTPAGTVTINNSVTLTLTGLVSETEIRVLQAGTTTEVGGIESSGTTYEFTYNYPTGYNVDIVIHNVAYVYIKLLNISLGASASSIPIQQIPDRWYKNPA